MYRTSGTKQHQAQEYGMRDCVESQQQCKTGQLLTAAPNTVSCSSHKLLNLEQTDSTVCSRLADLLG